MIKIILIAVIAAQSLFALVTIAPVEIGDKPGLSGKLEAGLETKRGNTDKDNYKASVRVTYDNNSSCVMWGEVSGEYGKSNGVEDTNKAFSHIRYIHSLTDDTKLRYELFAQLESDDFRQINSRILGGGGLRYKVFNSPENGKGYVGVGGFHESIRYKDSNINPSEENLRLNSYLAYTLGFNKKSKFTCGLYYQPMIDDFSDYVQSSQLEVKLHVVKSLFLKLTASWDVDSRPPVGVEKSDFTQTVTFIFDF